jgi:hypothetical protein
VGVRASRVARIEKTDRARSNFPPGGIPRSSAALNPHKAPTSMPQPVQRFSVADFVSLASPEHAVWAGASRNLRSISTPNPASAPDAVQMSGANG